jgi:hypothetical protein
MNFLQTDLWAGPQDEVQVDLDAQANVLLLDDSNFSLYQRGALIYILRRLGNPKSSPPVAPTSRQMECL